MERDGVIKAIVVDDEPVARQTIRLLLQNEPDVELVAECPNGTAAVDAIKKETPDLIFLDIQMPGMNGFEVLSALSSKELPAVIFTTAYDKYALKAFEVHALDYLLKPFDDDRFRQSLEHAKSVILGNKVEEISRQLFDLLERYDARLPALAERAAGKDYLTRFMVKSAGRTVIVDVADVDWIVAEGNYVSIHAQGKKHLLREKIGALETQLDPRKFVRIHRSTIVRTDLIKTMKPLFNGDHLITLAGGTEFTLSRTYRERVLASLGKPM
ncbi:MAG: LytTR family DNA-binding domain-containing protein [Bacteroidota bacterium]